MPEQGIHRDELEIAIEFRPFSVQQVAEIVGRHMKDDMVQLVAQMLRNAATTPPETVRQRQARLRYIWARAEREGPSPELPT